MTEIERRFAAEYASISLSEEIEFGEEANTVHVSGARRGGGGGRRREKTEGTARKKGAEKLSRQDTFVLNSPNMPRKSSPRTKSAYGIASILEKASQSAGLTDDAKRYIGTHMRLLTDENIRLSAEVERLRKVEAETSHADNLDKQIKIINAQLQKEKGKNKMLLQRLKEGDTTNQSQDIIWGQGDDDVVLKVVEKAEPPLDLLTRSCSPLTLLSLSTASNPTPATHNQNSEGIRMTRSFSTSRIGTPPSTKLRSSTSRLGTPPSRIATPINRNGTATRRNSTASTIRSSAASTIKPATATSNKTEGEVELLQRKVRVYRTQAASLKQEVDRLRDILTREVGEGNIDLVLLGGMEAGPVGRAQQIDHLQQTVNHLQVELERRETSALSQYFADSESDSLSHSHREKSPGRTSRRENDSLKIVEGPTNRTSSSFSVLEGPTNQGDKYWTAKFSELETVRKASEVEKKRLGELVRLLTSRLSNLEQRTREAEQGEREERVKNAHLQRLLERKQILAREEGRSTEGLNLFSSLQDDDDLHDVDGDQLRWEVSRLREEGRALKRELGEARAAREEMLRIYSRMMDEARSLFQNKS